MFVSPEEQARLDELRAMERFYLRVVAISAAALVVAVHALLFWARP